MQSKAETVAEYVASLPEDRRRMVDALRKVIKKNIDKAFAEGMQYGGIGYYLPHSKYPAGYHCDPKQPLPFAGIVSQKGHLGLYLFGVYTSPAQQAALQKEWRASGKKLDMGKSCIRLKKLEDIPLDVVGRVFARQKAADFVAGYEASLGATARKPRGAAAAAKPGKKAAMATKRAGAKTARKAVARKPARAKKA